MALRVQPRAAEDVVCAVVDGVLKVRVCAAPVEGAANEQCVRVLAAWLGCARSEVSLVSGGQSRNKVFEVLGVALSDVLEREKSLPWRFRQRRD